MRIASDAALAVTATSGSANVEGPTGGCRAEAVGCCGNQERQEGYVHSHGDATAKIKQRGTRCGVVVRSRRMRGVWERFLTRILQNTGSARDDGAERGYAMEYGWVSLATEPPSLIRRTKTRWLSPPSPHFTITHQTYLQPRHQLYLLDTG